MAGTDWSKMASLTCLGVVRLVGLRERGASVGQLVPVPHGLSSSSRLV